jgi:mannitol/fructose-specific phosphotransferase system IIA component (Ntr-type)
MYPSETEIAPRSELPAPVELHSLNPSHVVLGIPRMPLRSALRTLLHTAFPANLKRLHGLTDILLMHEAESPMEILPGVLVLRARVDDLSRAMLLLGTSAEGLEDGSGRRVRLVFVLLSPADQPQEHLRQLAAIATFVGNAERLEEILRCRSAEQLFRLSHGRHA